MKPCSVIGVLMGPLCWTEKPDYEDRSNPLHHNPQMMQALTLYCCMCLAEELRGCEGYRQRRLERKLPGFLYRDTGRKNRPDSSYSPANLSHQNTVSLD